MEVGRVNKTLYLLNYYIDDEDYRRVILTQLKRGKAAMLWRGRSATGSAGEIRKRYREGQKISWGTGPGH